MTLKTALKDGTGTGNLATVSTAGELVITGFGTVQTKFQILNSAAVGFNFFPPQSGYEFVITAILLDMTVAATVTIYEASSATTLNVDKTILTASLIKNAFQAIMLPFGGFIPITVGEFLNVKIDLQPISATIMGFYRPV